MSDEPYLADDLRCHGKAKAPWLTDEQLSNGWDRCYRRTRHESGYCYQHRAQEASDE